MHRAKQNNLAIYNTFCYPFSTITTLSLSFNYWFMKSIQVYVFCRLRDTCVRRSKCAGQTKDLISAILRPCGTSRWSVNGALNLLLEIWGKINFTRTLFWSLYKHYNTIKAVILMTNMNFTSTCFSLPCRVVLATITIF